jgi:hypothetical protein
MGSFSGIVVLLLTQRAGASDKPPVIAEDIDDPGLKKRLGHHPGHMQVLTLVCWTSRWHYPQQGLTRR